MLGNATKLKTARNIKLQGAVSGNANFDGSKDIEITTTQNNFAVIEGNLQCNANTQDSSKGECTFTATTVNYPSGFTKDNCCVISLGGKGTTASNRGYGYAVGGITDAIDLAVGTEPKRVILENDCIRIQIGNLATESKDKSYRIVLMKIK